MDRNEYVARCKNAAYKMQRLQRLSLGNFDEKEKVIYKKTEYIPQAYILRFGKMGEALHTAEILDKNKNAVLIVKLNDID